MTVKLTANDMYTALQDEYMGMVKSFNRRYSHNWDWRENTGILDITFFDVLFFMEDGMILSAEKQDEINAELDEIHARHRALNLRDNEAGRIFDMMHNEHLDGMV